MHSPIGLASLAVDSIDGISYRSIDHRAFVDIEQRPMRPQPNSIDFDGDYKIAGIWHAPDCCCAEMHERPPPDYYNQ